MSNKVVFICAGHYSLDDRIFYHQAKCLQKNGFDVSICSTKELLVETVDDIDIDSYYDGTFSQKEKLKLIVAQLTKMSPDIIFCDTPLTIVASAIYKKKSSVKIIYDLTEWYPSKKNVSGLKGFQKIKKFFKLIVLNIYAGFKSDVFIFGEYYKSIPFKVLFFWKSYLLLPYYPDLKYIKYHPLRQISKEINLLYSGIVNLDKGIENFLDVIDLLSTKRPDIQINAHIIGYFPTKEDEIHFHEICNKLKSNVSVKFKSSLMYEEFCNTIGCADIFFDLRNDDFENTHCLPIKMFYYLACGRPIIYSNLRSIRKEVTKFDFGYLSKPDDADAISNQVIRYVDDPDIYNKHACNAFDISRNKYNWKLIESDFILFVENLKKS